MLKLLILLFVLVMYVFVFSLCRISAIADQEMEQMMRERMKEQES